jgi:hypothetical protein
MVGNLNIFLILVVEHLEHKEVKKFPISFLLAFLGYTLILMIEKIIFDTHAHLGEENDEVDPDDDQDDDERDPYPLFELKEEGDNLCSKITESNLTSAADKQLDDDNSILTEKINISSNTYLTLKRSSTTHTQPIKEINRTQNFRKSGYNIGNISFNISNVANSQGLGNGNNGNNGNNGYNGYNGSNKINTLKKNPQKKSILMPQLLNRYGTTIIKPEDLSEVDRNLLKSNMQSKNGSFSIISRAKRDKINNYLETFKIDTVERKEQHFKNLFSTAGKMSSILLINDSKNQFLNSNLLTHY